MLGGLGLPELIIILLIIVLLFGGAKLPELGEAVGKTVKNFKKGMGEEDDAKKDAKDESAPKSDPKDEKE